MRHCDETDVDIIDLFGLYILFSRYRSCDNTQEVWSPGRGRGGGGLPYETDGDARQKF